MYGACSTRGKMRNAYKILVGKSLRKWPLERLGCGSKDDIRMDLKEIEWEGVNWIHLAQDRV